MINSATDRRWIPILNKLFDKYERLIKNPDKNKDDWLGYGCSTYCSLCQATRHSFSYHCQTCPISIGGFACGGSDALRALKHTLFHGCSTKIVKAARERRKVLKRILKENGWKFEAWKYKVIGTPEPEEVKDD